MAGVLPHRASIARLACELLRFYLPLCRAASSHYRWRSAWSLAAGSRVDSGQYRNRSRAPVHEAARAPPVAGLGLAPSRATTRQDVERYALNRTPFYFQFSIFYFLSSILLCSRNTGTPSIQSANPTSIALPLSVSGKASTGISRAQRTPCPTSCVRCLRIRCSGRCHQPPLSPPPFCETL